MIRHVPRIGDQSSSAIIPEHVWRVHAGEDPELERLVPVLGAPHVGRADPEHLPLAVLAQTRQQLLVVVPPHPLVCNDYDEKLIRIIRLPDFKIYWC